MIAIRMDQATKGQSPGLATLHSSKGLCAHQRQEGLLWPFQPLMEAKQTSGLPISGKNKGTQDAANKASEVQKAQRGMDRASTSRKAFGGSSFSSSGFKT